MSTAGPSRFGVPGTGFRLTPRGPAAALPATQRRIEAMIAAAQGLRGGDPAAMLTIVAPRSSGRSPYVLQAAALSGLL